MASGGGKGGSPLAFLPNGFIVKQLSPGDHAVLLAMSASLCQRILQGSLLVRFFMHFETPSRRYYGVMANALHIRGVKDQSCVRWKLVFDLKGCRDDKLLSRNGERIREVHKRWYMAYSCWYGCDYCCHEHCASADRRAYFAGKQLAWNIDFHLTPSQVRRVRDRMAEDVAFLRDRGTMDYSLLVGIQSFASAQEANDAGVGNAYYICRRSHVGAETKGGKMETKSTPDLPVDVYYLAIIDFFQEWTWSKVIARCLKSFCAPKPLSTVPPGAYAEQFLRNISAKFSPDAVPIEGLEPAVDSLSYGAESRPVGDEKRRFADNISRAVSRPVDAQPMPTVETSSPTLQGTGPPSLARPLVTPADVSVSGIQSGRGTPPEALKNPTKVVGKPDNVESVSLSLTSL